MIGGGSATIQNNYIGTDISGTKDEGCGSSGIIIAATSNNVIGGTSASTQGNIIAFNGTAGKFVPGIWLYGGGTGNQMLGNTLFSNHGPGIDIVKKGKTPDGVNAMDPGDADTGTNNLQNQPQIGYAGLTAGSPGSIHFLAGLNSTPKHTYRIEFFGNPRDNTGSVQAHHFIGYTTVTTDKTGAASIDMTISGKFTDTFVTATATDLKSHDTSELCVAHPTYGGYVSGVVFNDANGDGVRQDTETGMNGITVYCDANADGKFEAGETNTVTKSNGSYKLDLLYGGSQDIRVDVPTGQRVTYPTTLANTVTLPTTKPSGKSFGLTSTVAISGLAFNDVNGDGIRETGDAGLSAWRIYIDKNNDGVWNSNEKSVLTSSSGAFRFNGLSAGTSVVRIVQRTGYTLSTPSAGYYTVKLAAGATKSARNFGEKPTT